ncbi:hypothetical protein H6G97_33980 [Nostoc flagelliforme FACHB-838]|uniref:Uncharacterized protein n=1 Tax=Nostoc flagelliforme FACHB-838 TaxID=2692904 RepID=A0ABR8DXV3_9NOSO|nr:hypothetical protein [Nostoc flagelliforme]MBD2534264.1 hypothetical protein [Nostoc flagelliforme FACHB-838]
MTRALAEDDHLNESDKDLCLHSRANFYLSHELLAEVEALSILMKLVN